MKKVSIILLVLLLIASFVVLEKTLAKGNAGDPQKPVDMSEDTGSTETSEPIIPYSEPYDYPDKDTGADEVEVDEDA